MPYHQRVNWEFLAAIKGSVAPTLGGTADGSPELASSCLWVFPPDVPHGWRGAVEHPAEVVVLHFSDVPAPLKQMVKQQGFLHVELTGGELRRVALAGKRLMAHYQAPNLLSEVYADRELLDFSLLFLTRSDDAAKSSLAGVNLNRVMAAETWLNENLSYAPTIGGAAKAAGISPSQLRRQFQKVRKLSPHQLLKTIRFNRATHLMATTDMKLARVAAECGFSSAANFCRAFRAFNGKPPDAWRREVFFQYKQPKQSDDGDHLKHGRRMRVL